MKWFLALLAVIALAVTANFSYDAGVNATLAKQSNAAHTANAENRTTETRQSGNVIKATDESKTREQAIRRDLAGVRAERDRLRDDLAASRRELSQAAADALRERTAALTDVFEQCSATIESLAGAADRHASDSLMFQQAWPK